jgi:hypothetical protein
MALEDGRFLLPRARYEELSHEQRAASRLVPVHPAFRVVALGVPVVRAAPLSRPHPNVDSAWLP